MEPQLQLCTFNDIPDLTVIAERSYRQHYLYLWTDESYAVWYINRSFSPASLQQQMADPSSSFFWVLDNNIRCGFIKLNRNHALPHAPGGMELERIYLLREFSGRGIGSAVVQQLKTLARERGKTSIWLKSMDSSPSVNFYEKAGFHITGKERLPFEGFRDEYRNMCVMEMEI